MRAPIIIAALMATAEALQTASGVPPAGGGAVANAPAAMMQVRLDLERCSSRAEVEKRRCVRQPAGIAVHWRSTGVVAGSQSCSLACKAQLLLPVVAAPSERYLCAQKGVYGASASSRDALRWNDLHTACLHHCPGVAARASGPCELSNGRDAANDYLCACADCGGGGPGCEQRDWSASCDGDAPCRTPSGGVGTVENELCITRQGAAASFEQLCTPGSAAPHAPGS